MCYAGLQGDVLELFALWSRVESEKLGIQNTRIFIKQINNTPFYVYVGDWIHLNVTAELHTTVWNDCMCALHIEGLRRSPAESVNNLEDLKVTGGSHMYLCPRLTSRVSLLAVHLHSKHFSLIKQPHSLNKWERKYETPLKSLQSLLSLLTCFFYPPHHHHHHSAAAQSVACVEWEQIQFWLL